jgi:GH25 family lysozyme M1 (1,4-beta-N-acetylmuramidase)
MLCRSPRTLLRLLALAATALIAAAAAPAAPPRYVRGLDVSRWSGRVDWPRVAAAGYRFAFAEATKGNRQIDPAYNQHRAGAAAAGIQFGAFHFARPSGRTLAAAAADALAEADRFLLVAQPRSGDLLPVLDLEQTGGLQPQALIVWTSTWLREVQRKLGVRAIIYSSPHFWATAMADTPVFALAGSPLWLAHWTRAPAPPTVPARNWGSSGWRFWQWTSCGHIPGVRHCVDQGQTLRSTSGRWNGRIPIAFAYQWLRCDATGASCASVADATAATYAVGDADAGFTLRVSVTASNRRGSASAVSAPTAVVQ